jgi:hypothetical protein
MMRMVRSRRCVLRIATPAVLVVLMAGCSDNDSRPQRGNTAVTLNVYQSQTLSGAGDVTFVNAGRYAVLPQFAATTDFAEGTSRSTVPSFSFSIGGKTPAPVLQLSRPESPLTALRPEDAFHMRLREIEREEAPRAIAYAQQLRERPPVQLRVQNTLSKVDRDFRVLSDLVGRTYVTVTARQVFAGNNILVYVDNQTPVTFGFSDADYAAFGKQFDADLFPIDVAAFGATSDQDGNARTLVLFTPIVNRLTLGSGKCGSYVAGFFNGADLSGSLNGNKAEVLYQAVPGEPAGGPTCLLLTQSTVRANAPATFIHELQHLISYNQHTLSRSGSPESVWMNEGLSHVAEELGGKLYESRYPCPNLPPCPPAGRTSTSQIFPDSAQGFLPPNFRNAYDFFSSRLNFSLTSPTAFGTIEERGVSWLFLRWFVDQKGEGRLSQLVQTRNVGTANVEAVAGESFGVLFADFLTAVLLDDYPGAAAGEIPSRYQYSSRNLRAIYARLNTTIPQNFPRAYPLELNDLAQINRITPTSAAATRTMKPGSFDLFSFVSTLGSSAVTFESPGGREFDDALKTQITVVRMPN